MWFKSLLTILFVASIFTVSVFAALPNDNNGTQKISQSVQTTNSDTTSNKEQTNTNGLQQVVKMAEVEKQITVKNNEVKTTEVKIDNNTKAEISFSSNKETLDKTNNSENNKTIEEKNDKKDEKPILKGTNVKDSIPSSGEKTKDKVEAKKNEEQNIIIGGKYDENSAEKVIVIKDGVKNINISFKPEINIGNIDKKNNDANKKKIAIKNVLKNKKKKAIVSKKKNQNKKAKKPTKAVNNKATAFKETPKEKDINVFTELKEVDKDSTNEAKSPKTIRQIYEENENIKQQNNKPEEQKEAKKTNSKQPIFIINRVVNIDEDLNVDEETIQKILNENDSSSLKTLSHTATDNRSFKTAYLGGSETAFLNQYDLIDANNLKYGEVAFINDYND